jgi:hypothetical protein
MRYLCKDGSHEFFRARPAGFASYCARPFNASAPSAHKDRQTNNKCCFSLSLSLSLLCSLYDMGVCPCPFDLAYDILTWFVPCANLVRPNLCQSCAASVFVTLSRAKFVPTLCDTLCANVFWQPCATIFLPTLCGGGSGRTSFAQGCSLKGNSHIYVYVYILCYQESSTIAMIQPMQQGGGDITRPDRLKEIKQKNNLN